MQPHFTILLAGGPTFGAFALANTDLNLKFAGALEFSDDSTLFFRDNHNGAIYSIEMPADAPEGQIAHSRIYNIGELLGFCAGAIQINDIAAHQVSNDIYVSVTRVGAHASEPAVVIVSQHQIQSLLHLSPLEFQKQALTDFSAGDIAFSACAGGIGPAMPRELGKKAVSLNKLAIKDIDWYQGEILVAGVAIENLLSSLRWISHQFDGKQGVANVEMYHAGYNRYYNRGPNRLIRENDGEPQLIAAYTCSQIVLVPPDRYRMRRQDIGSCNHGSWQRSAARHDRLEPPKFF